MKLLLLLIGVAMCMEAENARLRKTNAALQEALNSLEESLGLDMDIAQSEKNLAEQDAEYELGEEDAVSRGFRLPRFPRGRTGRTRTSRRSSRRRSSGGGFGGDDNGDLKKVCNRDNCRGTSTNGIPSGEQWTRVGQASSSGCCSMWLGACDWCAPPEMEEDMEEAKEEAVGKSCPGGNWYGTAPFCRGECPAGYHFREKAKLGENWGMPYVAWEYRKFGATCTTGTKSYCCPP